MVEKGLGMALGTTFSSGKRISCSIGFRRSTGNQRQSRVRSLRGSCRWITAYTRLSFPTCWPRNSRALENVWRWYISMRSTIDSFNHSGIFVYVLKLSNNLFNSIRKNIRTNIFTRFMSIISKSTNPCFLDNVGVHGGCIETEKDRKWW